MSGENSENQTDHHLQTDTYALNMNSKLIDDSLAEFCDMLHLKTVQELSLCSNHLPSILNHFFQHLSNLGRLDLSKNNLKELPDSFNLLTKLEHLKIDNNEFQSLPKVLAGIRSLKSLRMSHNKIQEHSEDLGNLINLEILDLSSNNLSNLPYSFVRLNRLRELNLAGNKFMIIPECIINGMRNLEILDLSLNKRINLNIPPCSRRLRKFYAMKNDVCKSFPRWLLTSEFSGLEEINLNRTEIIKFRFPDENSLLSLRRLSITQSTISDHILNKLTRNMIRLEIMDIGNDDSNKEGNIFCSLPIHQLKNPQLVKELYLQRVGLPIMSRSVKDLSNITVMNLSQNRITWLPDEFCLLRKLEVLIIDNNGLATFPHNFGNLVALKELIAGHNNLSSLPASMNLLKELRLLDLYDNEFTEIPWDVVNLENIQGLDLELNSFSTNNLMIRNESYEVLRKSIHKEYASFSQRIVGAKVYPEESKYLSSASSASSVNSEFYREDETPTNQISYFNENNFEENWDLSEDSDEDFEPNFIFPKRYRSSSSTFPSTSGEHFFCPEDLHSTSVKAEVLQMRDDARLMFNFEDGQFDDA